MEAQEASAPGLSEQEIEELRARVRRELEAEEQELLKLKQRQEALRSNRSTRIREIERDEEERFYRERGYRRFVDRRGNTRWLSPDQAARWEEERAVQHRRRRSLGRTLASRRGRRIVVTVVAGVTLTLFALFLAFLRRG